MNATLRMHPQPPECGEGTVIRRAVVEAPGTDPWTLWFRTAEAHASHLSETADAFVLAGLFYAMRRGLNMRVEGPVAPSLIRNLHAFQTAWARWMPDRYRRIEINAQAPAPEPSPSPARIMTAFSGGLDSCFTVWQQTRVESPAVCLAPDMGLMVHGLDIPVDDRAVFVRASEKARAILASVGIPLGILTTNLRTFGDAWDDAHGAGLAACLHAMGAQHRIALVPGTHAYEALRLPFGSNPLTDPLLSSDRVSLVYEGAGFTRVDKARAVSVWPEALRDMRVCWQGAQLDRNCGVCGKCVAFGICFAVNALPMPPCMPIPDLAAAIHTLKRTPLAPYALLRMRERLTLARERGIQAPWVDAVADLLGEPAPPPLAAPAPVPARVSRSRISRLIARLRRHAP